MLANAPNVRLRMRNPVCGPGGGPNGGGLYVSELQRSRLLDAAFAVVFDRGYGGMAVRSVCERAGVSAKTFYDLFSDRDDCFLAAFDYGVEQLATIARPAYEQTRGEWVDAVRASLGELLVLLEEEPALSRLLFVEALAAGPRVLAARARVLAGLAGVIDEGRSGASAPSGLPVLTGEGIVGAVFGVIHARLLEHDRSGERRLVGLLNPLMAMIVLPYRGHTAAARELTRPVSETHSRRQPLRPERVPARMAGAGGRSGRTERVSGSRTQFRLTVRTHAVLAAVAANPGGSNREVSDLVQVSDQGQISRLMMRLEGEGLIENTGGGGQGARKAWRLTSRGEKVMQANRPLRERAA